MNRHVSYDNFTSLSIPYADLSPYLPCRTSSLDIKTYLVSVSSIRISL